MARKGGLTLSDEKLLTLAANGRSAEEIGKELGMSPERALLRVRELLKSRDAWDDIEREKLLLHSIYDLKERLQRNIDVVVSDPKMLEGYRKTLELLGQTLERRSRINDDDIEKVTRTQGLLLMRLIEAGYSKARQLLAAEYPDVDVTLIDSAFAQGMDEARIEVEQYS